LGYHVVMSALAVVNRISGVINQGTLFVTNPAPGNQAVIQFSFDVEREAMGWEWNIPFPISSHSISKGRSSLHSDFCSFLSTFHPSRQLPFVPQASIALYAGLRFSRKGMVDSGKPLQGLTNELGPGVQLSVVNCSKVLVPKVVFKCHDSLLIHHSSRASEAWPYRAASRHVAFMSDAIYIALPRQ
jgi:hypothetical protein